MTNQTTRPKVETRSNPTNRPNYTLRRVGAAVLMVAAAGGLVAAQEGWNRFQDMRAENQKYDTFSEPGIANNLEKHKIDPADVLITEVQLGEKTPLDVARNLDAKNVVGLADTISAQLGGAGNMHIGDTIAVPKDLLEPPKPEK